MKSKLGIILLLFVVGVVLSIFFKQDIFSKKEFANVGYYFIFVANSIWLMFGFVYLKTSSDRNKSI